MKIFFDGIITSLQKNGGISVYFNEIIKRLSFDEYIFKADGILNENFNDVIVKNRFLERYRTCEISNTSYEPDLFHSSYYRLPDINIPIVTTVHDFTYEKYICGFPKYVHSWQKNKAIKGSDKIICVSNNTANDLLKYCPVDENKIEVIHNGVSNDYFLLENRKAYTSQVVFVGSRAKYKNFFLAVDAVAKCPELTLTIVGGGRLKPNEIDYLDNKLSCRYDFLGFVSNNELNTIYNSAYCLLYPSDYEGFGIPVIEAMKSGCPVIAKNSSSIPEVSGGAALLLDNLNVYNLSDALCSLSNSSTRNKLISSGIKNSQRFSWEHSFQETKKVYQSLL